MESPSIIDEIKVKGSDIDKIFKDTNFLKKYLTSLGYQNVLFLYHILYENKQHKEKDFKSFLRTCKQNPQNKTQELIGECLQHESKHEVSIMIALPRLVDYLIDGKDELLKELKELTKDDKETPLDLIIRTKMKRIIKKKDDEYGVTNSDCNLTVENKDYDINNMKSKSPSLQNIGRRDLCPPHHKMENILELSFKPVKCRVELPKGEEVKNDYIFKILCKVKNLSDVVKISATTDELKSNNFNTNMFLKTHNYTCWQLIEVKSQKRSCCKYDGKSKLLQYFNRIFYFFI